MSSNRRIFLKKLAAGSAGLLIAGADLGQGWNLRGREGEVGSEGAVFPFLRYIPRYNVGDYLCKDQGGKFIQMEVLGTENDRQIVEKIRSGVLEKVYGNPVRWSRFEAGEVEKSVWLNRFYYLPSFARMYYLTHDKTYTGEMMGFISKWIEENPLLPDSPAKTYNWRDMQVAWRSINLSWCYYVSEKVLTANQKEMIVTSLKQHAAILLQGFGKQPLNDFNHQAHGALAMLYLGTLFPSLEQAAGLKEKAVNILSHHLEYAFYKDGGNVELMFGYYPFETQIFRDAYLLCKANGVEPPAGILEKLKQMAGFLAVTSQPDGTMPPVNDSYEMPTSHILATVNELLKKSDRAKSGTSGYFPETQVAVMRQSGKRNGWYVLAYPAQSIGGHAHAGRLATTLWLNGQPVLVDSGCTNYDNPDLVSWYRTSRAHNTVLIDGKTDEATSGSRLWVGRRPTANRITDWTKEGNCLFCQMVSPGTEAVNNGVSWSRSLALIGDDLLVMHDRFEATGTHTYEALFHFPPIKVSQPGNGRAILIPGRSNLAIVPADPGPSGSIDMLEGKVSVNGKGMPAPMASCKYEGENRVHAVLAFIPRVNRLSQVSVQQQVTDCGIGIKIDMPNGKTIILLMRNPQPGMLKAWGKQTNRVFEVFD